MSSQRGAAAERIAAEYLSAHGLQILTQNYRCRLGEIDLIARDADTLCFVEVRYRRTETYGGPAATVDSRKQQRVVRAATHFLFTQGGDGRFPSRFDVVSITGELREGQAGSRRGRSDGASATALTIQWFKNAFELSGWGAG